jgi:hypothetical protein
MRWGCVVAVISVCFIAASETHGQSELIAHWPFTSDTADVSAAKRAVRSNSVRLIPDGPNAVLKSSAEFDGHQSVIEVDSAGLSEVVSGPFSVSTWIQVPEVLDDVPGDILSLWDPSVRAGFHLGLYSHRGVTNSQSNERQLHFGMDNGQLDPEFKDHGRLGSAVFVFALCVHNGRLYASTCSAGATEAGHVFRYEGDDRWTDLGSPDAANAVSAMTTHNGDLYVASGKYRLAGSSLSESDNPNMGGRVFRLGPDDKWISCGRVSEETEAVSSLIEFRGQLYAASLYKPAGFFRYEGDERWVACDTPEGKRVEATTVFNGHLYATCYDEGAVFRFDGEQWERVGTIPEATQTYGFAVHDGSLFVSEWPKAHVYRYRGGTMWDDAGKLGMELEAMPLLVYNGSMYGGTLPSAEVYRFDGQQQWTRIAQVDTTPDVKYRRAWSMAVYQGRLFVGTLPSGRVLSIEAGRNATHDTAMAAGWHHVAAVRGTDRMDLYLDGKKVAQSEPFDAADYVIHAAQPLKIGFGAQDHFHGRIADLRIYRGALSAEEIRSLSALE